VIVLVRGSLQFNRHGNAGRGPGRSDRLLPNLWPFACSWNYIRGRFFVPGITKHKTRSEAGGL
jgi:hypothetical protein